VGSASANLEGQDGLVGREGPEVAPDEGVTGRPPLRLGRRRLLHRSRRRHGAEGRPAPRAPPLACEVGCGGRRRVPDAEPGGAIHQRSGAAEWGDWPVGSQRAK
jgi:hypothetical protein